jgi:hypothetical protein
MMLVVVLSLVKSRAALQLENIALRHQIAFAHVDGVALGVEDRQARNRDCMASEYVPEVLDVESSARPAWTASGFRGVFRQK